LLAQETGIKGGRRLSQNRYISPPCGGPFRKFGEFVDLTDVITPAKFGSKIFVGFSRPRGRKTHFPFRNQMAYITVRCAAALECDESSQREANFEER